MLQSNGCPHVKMSRSVPSQRTELGQRQPVSPAQGHQVSGRWRADNVWPLFSTAKGKCKYRGGAGKTWADPWRVPAANSSECDCSLQRAQKATSTHFCPNGAEETRCSVLWFILCHLSIYYEKCSSTSPLNNKIKQKSLILQTNKKKHFLRWEPLHLNVYFSLFCQIVGLLVQHFKKFEVKLKHQMLVITVTVNWKIKHRLNCRENYKGWFYFDTQINKSNIIV